MLSLDEAKCHFDRVADEHELSCVVANAQYIRYESAAAYFTVNFDRDRSYELHIEIGQQTAGSFKRPFSLSEILRLRNVPEAEQVSGIAASNTAKLINVASFVSDLLLKYAGDFLNGSEFSFVQIARFREKESIKSALERELRTARLQADIAWKNKDYAGVILALEPVESHLSPSECKRLAYASHKLTE